ncbi:MAG: hypothetical protein FWD64_10380 [Acidobacteriaceae bacterium]|nr:hypothetical protein [Acidobacteriaceae bacterium]
MSKTKVMVRLVLMNLLVVAALVYRWKLGAPASRLIIIGIVAFVLVNVLILAAAKFSASSR